MKCGRGPMLVAHLSHDNIGWVTHALLSWTVAGFDVRRHAPKYYFDSVPVAAGKRLLRHRAFPMDGGAIIIAWERVHPNIALLHASPASGIRHEELIPLEQGVEHAHRRSMRLPLPAVSRNYRLQLFVCDLERKCELHAK
eukprot:793544-Pyramimonas_sp.AAC.1